MNARQIRWRLRLAFIARYCIKRQPLLPWSREAERQARKTAKIPDSYPENMRPLRGRHEATLRQLAQTAWPDSEYQALINEDGGNA